MKRKIVKYLLFAQASFFLCLLISIFITTKGFSDNRGLSYYGEHLDTLIPFALGFCLCDFFLLKVARLLPELNKQLAVFTVPLQVLSILLISIVLTPDNLNSLFNVLHIIASSALFLFELLFSIWLIIRWHKSATSWLLLIAQFTAGIIAAMSEFQVTHFLSESSLFYQLFFSSLLIWVMFNITNSISHEAKQPTLESVDT